MRVLTLVLLALIAGVQYPLWLGKGGWLRVWEIERQVAVRGAENEKLKARNGALDAEVRDLKNGFDAIEERARSELGMVKDDEIYFHVLKPGEAPPPEAAPVQSPPKPAAKAAPRRRVINR